MKSEKNIMNLFKLSVLCASCVILFTGCASVDRANSVHADVKKEVLNATISTPKIVEIEQAPIAAISNDTNQVNKQSLNESYPKVANKKETRFNFVINNAPVTTILSALVDGSSYSMILPQELTGNVTLNLKNVTAFDVLETLRTVYNYEYEVSDKKIIVYPNGLRTKIFHVNHLIGVRRGSSELKISSGSLTESANNNTQSNNNGVVTTNNGGTGKTTTESAKITTTVDSDFWKELNTVLTSLIGSEKGRTVMVSPQTNTLMIKAMPSELREVEKYLDKIQVVIDRQVIIEAKLIEVQLNSAMQTGINWAAFKNGNSRASVGFGAAGSTLANKGDITLTGLNPVTATPGANLVTGALNSAGSMFSLAFQTGNFASVLNFLETQGELQVLSSPRIATMNNQKALLKVGTDEFFVTNVTTTSTATAAGTTNTPSVTTQPFFSGIALDITPQIDDNGFVTMHVRPSVSKVTTITKNINLGSLGNIVLPLASSTISETDSVVRVENNQIVAIGGLMKQYSKKDKSQVPGAAEVPIVGNAFQSTDNDYQKYELVILLKPQVITARSDWDENLNEIRQRLADFDQPLKTITVNGVAKVESKDAVTVIAPELKKDHKVK